MRFPVFLVLLGMTGHSDEEVVSQGDNAGCQCVEFINATVIVTNAIKPPTFNFSRSLINVCKANSLALLEAAAKVDDRFRFTAKYTYHKEGAGYFIETINGLTWNWDEDKTFWKSLDSAGNGHEQGVSEHRPQNGEILQFVFTRASDPVG